MMTGVMIAKVSWNITNTNSGMVCAAGASVSGAMPCSITLLRPPKNGLPSVKASV